MNNPTKYEKIVKDYLDSLGIEYEFQCLKWGSIVDFYLPEYKIVIEVDGKHHCYGRQKITDHNRDVKYALGRIKTIRLQNADVYNGNYVNIIRTNL